MRRLRSVGTRLRYNSPYSTGKSKNQNKEEIQKFSKMSDEENAWERLGIVTRLHMLKTAHYLFSKKMSKWWIGARKDENKISRAE